jgi:hypothetical protein
MRAAGSKRGEQARTQLPRGLADPSQGASCPRGRRSLAGSQVECSRLGSVGAWNLGGFHADRICDSAGNRRGVESSSNVGTPCGPRSMRSRNNPTSATTKAHDAAKIPTISRTMCILIPPCSEFTGRRRRRRAPLARRLAPSGDRQAVRQPEAFQGTPGSVVVHVRSQSRVDRDRRHTIARDAPDESRCPLRQRARRKETRIHKSGK